MPAAPPPRVLLAVEGGGTAIHRLALERPPLARAGSQLRGEVCRGRRTAIASPIGDVAFVEDPCRGAVALAQRHFKGHKP